MQIKKFKDSDAIKLVRMHRATISSVNKKHYTREQIQAWASSSSARRFKKYAKDRIIFVAFNKNNIVGFIEFKNNEVKALYVHKDYLRKNVGRRLLEKIEEIAYKKGIRKLICFSTITAKGFYKKHGYKPIKKTKIQIKNQKLNCFYMEKSLK